MPSASQKIVDGLNRALSLEYTAVARCLTYAASVTGVQGVQFAEKLRAMAAEELPHAQELTERIIRLGGKPRVDVGVIEPLEDLDDVLQALLKEEREAVALYRNLFNQVSKKDLLLWEAVEHILEDELEHLEELEQMLGI